MNSELIIGDLEDYRADELLDLSRMMGEMLALYGEATETNELELRFVGDDAPLFYLILTPDAELRLRLHRDTLFSKATDVVEIGHVEEQNGKWYAVIQPMFGEGLGAVQEFHEPLAALFHLCQRCLTRMQAMVEMAREKMELAKPKGGAA